MHLKPGLFLLVFFILSACINAEVATPAPTQEAIRVFYAPTMRVWADSLAKCASNNPQISLYFFPQYTPGDVSGQYLTLSLGQVAQSSDNIYISQVGWDQLVIVVNGNNPTLQLSQVEFEQIFSGELSVWMEGKALPIQVWVLPNDDPYTELFSKVLLPDVPLTSEARLAPDAEAMIEAISQNPGAIGFLPKTIVDSTKTLLTKDLKIVSLPASLNTELHLPVVAITQIEPTGFLRQVLVCMQTTGE